MDGLINYTSDPAARGRENYLAGYQLDDNPYPLSDESHSIWEKAWVSQSELYDDAKEQEND